MHQITIPIQELIHFLQEHATGENGLNHIIDSIRQVRSMRDLYNLMGGLLPLLNSHAPAIAIGILEIITKYAEHKEHEALHHAINQMVQMQALQMQVQIQQTRVINANLLVNHSIARHINAPVPEETKQEIENAPHVLRSLPPPNFQVLVIAENFASQVLDERTQHEAAQGNNIPHLLDQIGSNVDYQNQLIEYIAYHRRYYNKSEPEIHWDHDLNYAQITMRYGRKLIKKIMNNLLKKFIANGGEKLVTGEYLSTNGEVPVVDRLFFGGLANSLENSAQELSNTIQRIALDENNNFVFTKELDGANLLSRYYHNEAKTDLAREWRRANWAHYTGGRPVLELEVANIIRLRTLIEFCYKTTLRISSPNNIPREMANGFFDVFKGVGRLGIGFFSAISHPRETSEAMQNFSHRMSTAEGRQEGIDAMNNSIQSSLNSIWEHPTRAAASTATSVAISYAAARTANSFYSKKPTYVPPPTIGMEEEGAEFVVNAMSSGVNLTSTTLGGAALATETLRQNRSEFFSKEQMNPLYDIEQVNQESACPVVTMESLVQLKEQLRTVKNMFEFYVTFVNWHKKLESKAINEVHVNRCFNL